MALSPAEICAEVDCLCAAGVVTNDTFKILVLQMLCNLMGVAPNVAAAQQPEPQATENDYGRK